MGDAWRRNSSRCPLKDTHVKRRNGGRRKGRGRRVVCIYTRLFKQTNDRRRRGCSFSPSRRRSSTTAASQRWCYKTREEEGCRPRARCSVWCLWPACDSYIIIFGIPPENASGIFADGKRTHNSSIVRRSSSDESPATTTARTIDAQTVDRAFSRNSAACPLPKSEIGESVRRIVATRSSLSLRLPETYRWR